MEFGLSEALPIYSGGLGIGIIKAFLTGPESTKDLVEESISRLCCPPCGRSSCEEGLTGPLFQDRSSLLLLCGVCEGELGKGGSVGSGASGAEPEGIDRNGMGFQGGIRPSARDHRRVR